MWRWLQRVLKGHPGPGLRWDRRLVFFASLGVVMGTVFDALHVWTGTAYYENTFVLPLFHVAWYVPLEFTAAGIVVGMARPELDEEFQRERSALSLRSVLLGLGCFAFAWGGSGAFTPFCWDNTGAPQCTSHPNAVILVLLGAFAAATWLAFDRTLEGVLVALFTAGIGVGVEASLVKLTDTYRYTHPDFLGVPMWLPPLYLIACGAIGNLGRFLKYPTVRRPEPSPDPSAPISDTA